MDAICYSAVIQEQSLGIHYNKGGDLNDYLVPESRFKVQESFLAIPGGPGLGIEVDEATVRERAIEEHAWRAPVWRHADGSIAEW